MEIIIGILAIIILVLLCYLFMLKREMKRIGNDLDEILKIDSNQLLHEKLSDRDIKVFLKKINDMVIRVREKEIVLERKDNYLQKEITNITHDLRTPLTSSLGYIDLILRSDMTKEEQLKELKIVQRRLIRLQELVSSFFEFSMVTTSNREVELTQTNLVALVEDCMSNFFDDFMSKNKNIDFRCDMKKCELNTNRDMMKRIIDNLLGNALKYSAGDLTIRLSEIKNDGNNRLLLSFSNDVGASDVDVEHIFDEFYTADISRTKGNTGLGLAIVKEFTEVLGGEIEAKMDENKLVIDIVFET
ncbi:MAG: HAMP domain-containing histidine kinase [Lachnospiraceae bacterium]|nr:HAMP domain-containing histidine kinase [Lachnospiraceae bacterium]